MSKTIKLTAKQEAFAQAVAIKGMNYSDAYRACYNTKENSPYSVWGGAWKIRSNQQVSSRIKELQDRKANRLLRSKQEYLEKLEQMAWADIRTLFNPQGDLKPIDELTEEQADLLEGLEVVEQFDKVKTESGDRAEHTGYVKKVKLASKRQILRDYAEARGWSGEKAEGPAVVVLREYITREVPHASGTDQRVIVVNGHGSNSNGRGIQSHAGDATGDEFVE